MIDSEEAEFPKDKYLMKKIKDNTGEKDYLDIWRSVPQLKDFNTRFSSIRALSLIVLVTFIMGITYMSGVDPFVTLSLGILFVLFFIVTFYDQCYNFVYVISFTFRRSFTFNPFSQIIFWQKEKDESTLFISNKDDLTHIALQLFKVEVIPENVHETTNTYIKALSDFGKLIPFTYQVVHIPVINFASNGDRHIQAGSQQSYKTYIYFCIHTTVHGFLRQFKINLLLSKIHEYQAIFRNLFASNFHHFRIKLLSGNELINGIRTLFIRDSVSDKSSEHIPNTRNAMGAFKIIFIASVVLYIDVFLSILGLFLYVIPVNFMVVFCIIGLWWRGLLFHSSHTLFLDKSIGLYIHFQILDFIFTIKFPTVSFSISRIRC